MTGPEKIRNKMASQNIIVRAVYKLSLTVRPCWVIGDVGGQKEKKKQVFHYTRWHVCVRQLAVRGLVRFFFPSPPRDFYATSSRAGLHCFCGRMVCTSCADSLDVCPLITLPSFICLVLLFFSFVSPRSLVVLFFPALLAFDNLSRS